LEVEPGVDATSIGVPAAEVDDEADSAAADSAAEAEEEELDISGAATGRLVKAGGELVVVRGGAPRRRLAV
jgi:hypothetical protein